MPLLGQRGRQGGHTFNAVRQQTRWQRQQHMPCVPGGDMSVGVFAVQFYMVLGAAQAAHRLAGVDARGIQAAVQSVGQRSHTAHQAH